MKVLLVSQFHHPEPNFKTSALARELVARGHSVQVLTGFPNYPSGKIYPGFRQRVGFRETLDGAQVIRVPLYPDHSPSSVRRAMNYGSFWASAIAFGSARVERPDVVYAYHPPLTAAMAAARIARRLRAPLVVEIQDMWPESISSTGMMGHPVPLRILKGWADRVYRRARAISVISDGFKANLIAKGVPAEKIHVLPNWADGELYRPLAPDPELGRAHGLDGRFNIMFAGNMGPAQALDSVLRAAAMLRDLPQVQFALIGDGMAVEALKEQVQRENLSNVRFLGRHPEAEMPRFFAWASALLIHLRDDPLFRITIPSKTAPYLASGRPVLCAVAGDGGALVERAGAGSALPPEDAEALAAAIRDWVGRPADELERMGEAGRRYFLEHLSQQRLIDRWEALLMECAQGSASQPANERMSGTLGR